MARRAGLHRPEKSRLTPAFAGSFPCFLVLFREKPALAKSVGARPLRGRADSTSPPRSTAKAVLRLGSWTRQELTGFRAGFAGSPFSFGRHGRSRLLSVTDRQSRSSLPAGSGTFMYFSGRKRERAASCTAGCFRGAQRKEPHPGKPAFLVFSWEAGLPAFQVPARSDEWGRLNHEYEPPGSYSIIFLTSFEGP